MGNNKIEKVMEKREWRRSRVSAREWETAVLDWMK